MAESTCMHISRYPVVTGSLTICFRTRNRLQGHWGVVDVRDSVEALRELGSRGLVDVKRSAIRGRSGGGFTTLQTLSTTTENFQVGTACFPASDLIALHVGCHKFQSQYIPGLVGAPLEEGLDLWKKRSPFYQAAQIKSPVLVRGTSPCVFCLSYLHKICIDHARVIQVAVAFVT